MSKTKGIKIVIGLVVGVLATTVIICAAVPQVRQSIKNMISKTASEKTPEEKAAVAKQKKQQRRARRKQETRDNLAKEEILQDDRFFVIAGYTSGGAPYGVTWEEMGLKPWEDLEENN